MRSARLQAEAQARAIGFAEEETGQIGLAIDEALANVINHGYGGPCDKPIDIAIEQVTWDGATGISITVRDFGRQVNPTEIRSRDLDDVRPGGLGVHIMRTVMDEVSYTPAEGGGMQLVMKKKLL